jgi:uncharacterized protein (TIGR02594 family)
MTSRGIRNNNPLNIEAGRFARSQPGYVGSDGRFAKFKTMRNGLDAAAELLRRYGLKGFDTIKKIIDRWAPPVENLHNKNYVRHVANRVGKSPTTKLNLKDPELRLSLARAMAEFETGTSFKAIIIAQEPKWLTLARAEIGTKELPGKGSNQRVGKYYQDSVKVLMPDSVPWCAAFVGAMLARAGVKPSGSLMARSYLTWGQKLSGPKKGCIAVFTRGRPPSGHVNFVDDFNSTTLWCVGGNQDDMVNRKAYPRSRVLGYRWPTEAKKLKGPRKRKARKARKRT